jgi:DNA-binding NarL/FixJ family response regulator
MASEAELLIIDDHPLFVDGFVAMVGQLRPSWIVETGATGAEAFSKLAQRPKSAALIDVFLPDRDGFNLLHAIRLEWPDLPIILISGRDHGAMEMRARSSPANGFIPKTTAAPQFVSLIESALAGRTAFASGKLNGDLPTLTPRQAQVLELLAAGHGNKEIRHRLGIAERTVRAHLTEVFQVLGVHGRMPAVIKARELGLIE